MLQQRAGMGMSSISVDDGGCTMIAELYHLVTMSYHFEISHLHSCPSQTHSCRTLDSFFVVFEHHRNSHSTLYFECREHFEPNFSVQALALRRTLQLDGETVWDLVELVTEEQLTDPFALIGGVDGQEVQVPRSGTW